MLLQPPKNRCGVARRESNSLCSVRGNETMHQPENVSGELVSIQCGKPETRSHAKGEWTTAFFKQTVIGPVEAEQLGLAGDGVADEKHHGGVDKAVLAYSADNYPRWESQLNRQFAHGGFGENLTIRGLDEDHVCIGDQWQIGSVLFEVAQPRQPCWKLGRRWDDALLPKLVIQNGRSGWYLRVLQPGQLEAGDSVELRLRSEPNWTITRANRVFYRGDSEEKQALAAVETLADVWKTDLKR